MPSTMGGKSIVATSTCLAVSTVGPPDGELQLSLGRYRAGELAEEPVCDHVLETPGRRIGVFTTDLQSMLECRVDGPETRVRVWTNHPQEPDVVLVAVGG